ncbi:MAG: Maf family nucleotide pyrophosphatase [Bacteroidota bacterium]
MLYKNLEGKRIILGSASPRRKQLLGGLGIQFDVLPRDVEESYPENLSHQQVAEYIAVQKAKAYHEELSTPECIVITADTIVCLKKQIIHKPLDFNDAVRILQLLSGNMHTVLTGVCITSFEKQVVFCGKTDVFFKPLSVDEIHFYIESCSPFDKAGAYGVQEWIGYAAIERIEGSFYNVMGLPTRMLYEELVKF